jgi:hypothetical protein
MGFEEINEAGWIQLAQEKFQCLPLLKTLINHCDSLNETHIISRHKNTSCALSTKVKH